MRAAKWEVAEPREEKSHPAALSSDSEAERESGAESEGGGPDVTQPEGEGWDGGTAKPSGRGR